MGAVLRNEPIQFGHVSGVKYWGMQPGSIYFFSLFILRLFLFIFSETFSEYFLRERESGEQNPRISLMDSKSDPPNLPPTLFITEEVDVSGGVVEHDTTVNDEDKLVSEEDELVNENTTVNNEDNLVTHEDKAVNEKNTGKQKGGPWSEAETKALEDGVAKYGVGKWTDIKKDPTLDGRSAKDCKDKWRNIELQDLLSVQRAEKSKVVKQDKEDLQREVSAALSAAAASIEAGHVDYSKLVEIGSVNQSLLGKTIVIRGAVGKVWKKAGHIVLVQPPSSIVCLLAAEDGLLSPHNIKLVANLKKDTCIAIKGIVSLPDDQAEKSIKGQKVVLKVNETYGLSEADLSKMVDEQVAKTKQKLKRNRESAAALAAAALDATASSLESTSMKVNSLDKGRDGQSVLVCGRVHSTHKLFHGTGWLTLEQDSSTVRCIFSVNLVGYELARFACSLPTDSFVAVEGTICIPGPEKKGVVNGLTQQVYIQVTKMPGFNETHTLAVDKDVAALKLAGKENTDLSVRILDVVCTPVDKLILLIRARAEAILRDFLNSEGFVEFHTKKLQPVDSQVVRLNDKGVPACLATSPLLEMQMASVFFRRIFEIGSVFKEGNTCSGLCEYIGLDVVMEVEKEYSEVMDIVDRLFVAIFNNLNAICKKELEVVRKQYHSEPLKFRPETLKLSFTQGVELLQAAGADVHPSDCLSTENERKLGEIVLELYDTEFYILHQFPVALKPFYNEVSSSSSSDPNRIASNTNCWSNSFDVFIRGEKIASGAQYVNDAARMYQRVGDVVAHGGDLGFDVASIGTYIDAFECGVPRHGGFGAVLDRAVMLFCADSNRF